MDAHARQQLASAIVGLKLPSLVREAGVLFAATLTSPHDPPRVSQRGDALCLQWSHGAHRLEIVFRDDQHCAWSRQRHDDVAIDQGVVVFQDPALQDLVDWVNT